MADLQLFEEQVLHYYHFLSLACSLECDGLKPHVCIDIYIEIERRVGLLVPADVYRS